MFPSALDDRDIDNRYAEYVYIHSFITKTE
jgi:hypothetical protein